MKRHKERETRYFQSHTDDFVESKKQFFKLPENYVWVNHNLLYRLVSRCLSLFVLVFSCLYLRFGLHGKVENRFVLKQCAKSGCFIYGNHTQPVGDAVIPTKVLFPKPCYVLAGPANLGIPVLGPLLPMIGALPIPDSIIGLKKLKEAISFRIAEKKCVAIYPEAHVWPWYTGIRDYPATAFQYPVENNAPSFCMTTTYQKRKHGDKPQMTIFIDGPYYPNRTLTKKKQREKLRDEIYECMKRRSQSNTYEYIRYEERKNEYSLLR